MAGSKLITQKLNGSTIIEVLISMVVIMVVFGIAMMIFANVTQSSISGKKLKAQAILNDALVKAENSRSVETQSSTIDDFRIEQSVKSYNDDKSLINIKLTAFDANQKEIATLRKVIISNE